jgi:hypothetical protein
LENDALYWPYNCSPRDICSLVGLIKAFHKRWYVIYEEENVKNLVGEPIMILEPEEERSDEVIEELVATYHKSFQGYAFYKRRTS